MSKTVKSSGSSGKTLLGAQIRAARALLRWSAADLVRESGVSHATIHRAETANGKTAMTFANATAIRRALEAAGVELLDEDGGGAGARFRKRVSD
jgi:transcriptional regulator with XRE-family HTH domain